MREHADNSGKLFMRTNNHEPNDVEVYAHLDLRGRSDVFSWIMPNEHSKIDHLARKGVTLMELLDALKYGWVEVEVIGIMSTLNIKEAIEVTNIMVGDPQDWLVLIVGS